MIYDWELNKSPFFISNVQFFEKFQAIKEVDGKYA